MDAYEMLGTIGEGTYGVVLRARHTTTRQVRCASGSLRTSRGADRPRKMEARHRLPTRAAIPTLAAGRRDQEVQGV
jgi:hypothetical protein